MSDAASGPSPVTHVDPAEAANRLGDDPEIRILDVRTPAEFEAGHLAGAVLVDFKAPGFEEGVRELDAAKTWLVHCKAGGRSMGALPKLQAAGFESLIHLDGGYDSWVSAGMATVKD